MAIPALIVEQQISFILREKDNRKREIKITYIQYYNRRTVPQVAQSSFSHESTVQTLFDKDLS